MAAFDDRPVNEITVNEKLHTFLTGEETLEKNLDQADQNVLIGTT